MMERNKLDRDKAKLKHYSGSQRRTCSQERRPLENTPSLRRGRQALPRKYQGSVFEARLGMVVFSRENKSKQQFPSKPGPETIQKGYPLLSCTQNQAPPGSTGARERFRYQEKLISHFLQFQRIANRSSCWGPSILGLSRLLSLFSLHPSALPSVFLPCHWRTRGRPCERTVPCSHAEAMLGPSKLEQRHSTTHPCIISMLLVKAACFYNY